MNIEMNESFERRYSPILDEEYVRQLGAMGLFDASLDAEPTPLHPEDDQWAVGSSN